MCARECVLCCLHVFCSLLPGEEHQKTIERGAGRLPDTAGSFLLIFDFGLCYSKKACAQTDASSDGSGGSRGERWQERWRMLRKDWVGV